MRHITILQLFFILLLVSPVSANFETTLTPQTNRLSFDGTLEADTAAFQINNLTGEAVSNFFITAHTDYGISMLEVYVDGTYLPTVQTETETGTVYPGKTTTRWIIPEFSINLVLIFHTLNASDQEYSFCGSKSFPFFGDVYSTAPPCCNNFRGNVNNSDNDIIDIADLVYYVDYSFGIPSGPAPTCFDEADVNADNTLDISDVVYLVAYMFDSGPLPRPCD